MLDESIYARTTSKETANSQAVFWGEQFEFSGLAEGIQKINVNLFRISESKKEHKKQKQKYILIGTASFELNSVLESGANGVEQWIKVEVATNLSSSKQKETNSMTIRMKMKMIKILVLPLEKYKHFADLLTQRYFQICRVLEPNILTSQKDDVGKSLVMFLHNVGKVKEYLTVLALEKVGECQQNEEQLLFRDNSIATKSVEAYLKLVGKKYLEYSLYQPVRELCMNPDASVWEVDPQRLPGSTPSEIQLNQERLVQITQRTFNSITESVSAFPQELRELFATWRAKCMGMNALHLHARLLCSSLFLRLLCPAILNPSLFDLRHDLPNEKASRALTLVAKSIHNLANGQKFGNKEPYMEFMNSFINLNKAKMERFLERISTFDDSQRLSLGFDGYIDPGKELARLQQILLNMVLKSPVKDDLIKQLYPLVQIMEDLENSIKDPNYISRATHILLEWQAAYEAQVRAAEEANAMRQNSLSQQNAARDFSNSSLEDHEEEHGTRPSLSVKQNKSIDHLNSGQHDSMTPETNESSQSPGNSEKRLVDSGLGESSRGSSKKILQSGTVVLATHNNVSSENTNNSNTQQQINTPQKQLQQQHKNNIQKNLDAQNSGAGGTGEIFVDLPEASENAKECGSDSESYCSSSSLSDNNPEINAGGEKVDVKTNNKNNDRSPSKSHRDGENGRNKSHHSHVKSNQHPTMSIETESTTTSDTESEGHSNNHANIDRAERHKSKGGKMDRTLKGRTAKLAEEKRAQRSREANSSSHRKASLTKKKNGRKSADEDSKSNSRTKSNSNDADKTCENNANVLNNPNSLAPINNPTDERTYKWLMTNDHDEGDKSGMVEGGSGQSIGRDKSASLPNNSIKKPSQDSSAEQLLPYIQKLEEELKIKNDIILNSKLEKDMQIKSLFQKVINLENDLQRERKRMNNLLDGKEKIIKRQEEKIVQLNETNSRLLAGLQRLKVHYTGSGAATGGSGVATTSGPGSPNSQAPGSPQINTAPVQIHQTNSGNSPTTPNSQRNENPSTESSPTAPINSNQNLESLDSTQLITSPLTPADVKSTHENQKIVATSIIEKSGRSSVSSYVKNLNNRVGAPERVNEPYVDSISLSSSSYINEGETHQEATV